MLNSSSDTLFLPPRLKVMEGRELTPLPPQPLWASVREGDRVRAAGSMRTMGQKLNIHLPLLGVPDGFLPLCKSNHVTCLPPAHSAPHRLPLSTTLPGYLLIPALDTCRLDAQGHIQVSDPWSTVLTRSLPCVSFSVSDVNRIYMAYMHCSLLFCFLRSLK